MTPSRFAVQPGSKVDLTSIPTDEQGRFEGKGEARDATEKNLEQLRELQERLYAGAEHAVLVVLQGMDTSGKDGAISKVFSGVNPQGCFVVSFKKPTPLELSHDFLWRIHHHAPPKGMITIFNRSHYESVLVERVHKIVDKEVWTRRYEQINQFESMLASEGTLICKFFLHISRDEQRERLQKRLDNPDKHWKFNPNDLDERKLWDKYQQAYEDCLTHCSTDAAPWHIIPADKKWHRDWAISEVLLDRLNQLNLAFPEAPPGLEKIKVE